jgi:1-deoxy-D-xylulose-5-phosphate synthase
MARILDDIRDPADLKRLSADELRTLAQEIRDELAATVARTGGHLSPNLGTVELTLALHTVFDSPRDKIVWDVGHQAYPHKLVTGRLDRFGTIRQAGGLSGFLAREESEHDVFGAGHASTSISAALGMAVARDLRGEDYAVVAVIGDGALTGGLAYEGLNNAGHLERPLIVVLNDNGMSISPNVGAISRILMRIRTHPRYREAKEEVWKGLERLPLGEQMQQAARRAWRGVKDFLLFTMFWEEMGFTYLGPIDGHDIVTLQETLRAARTLNRPVLIHAVTTKGKGFEPAEADNEKWHGIAAVGAKKPAAPAYGAVFADTLIQLAETDPRIVAITAAMASGTNLARFGQRFPDRFFDVGIAEAHAVTFAAGLATQGMKPVCTIYSTFLQRAYDQVIHDVCVQNLDVTFAVPNGGLVGEDGRTHQGVYDLTYLRCIPNMVVMAPKDENELRHLLVTAITHPGPAAIRYPRGAGLGVPLDSSFDPIPLGQAEVLREGSHVAILAIGAMVAPALAAADRLAADGIETTVVNARFVKPLDEALLRALAARFDALLTVEENVIAGGFGSAVSEALDRLGLGQVRVHRLGVPDVLVDHASQAQQRQMLGLTADGIAAAARALRTDASPLLSGVRAHAD